MENKMEKGSMIVLAIIATLILSMIVVAGLTVSTTEVNTTHNYYLNKVSYYEAVEGMELVINQICAESDPEIVSNLLIEPNDFKITQDGTQKLFITGTLVDLQNSTTQTVKQFKGFTPPPLANISLGLGVNPIIWYVPITSEVTVNRKRSYTEIEAGICSSVTVNQ